MSSIAEIVANVNIGSQHAQNAGEYAKRAKGQAEALPVPALISGLGELAALIAQMQRDDALPALQGLYQRASEEAYDGDEKYKREVGFDPSNEDAAAMCNSINFAGLKARSSERGCNEINDRLTRVAGYLDAALKDLSVVEHTYYPELSQDADSVVDYSNASREAAGRYTAGLVQPGV